MKRFKAKKFLVALALGGFIAFTGTTPTTQATIEIAIVFIRL